MTLFELDIPPHVGEVIRRLPPDLKRSVKEALRSLVEDPHLGDPLVGDLEGLWKYRVRRYRIVYRPDPQRRLLQVYAVGHRREIYDKLTAYPTSS